METIVTISTDIFDALFDNEDRHPAEQLGLDSDDEVLAITHGGWGLFDPDTGYLTASQAAIDVGLLIHNPEGHDTITPFGQEFLAARRSGSIS